MEHAEYLTIIRDKQLEQIASLQYLGQLMDEQIKLVGGGEADALVKVLGKVVDVANVAYPASRLVKGLRIARYLLEP